MCSSILGMAHLMESIWNSGNKDSGGLSVDSMTIKIQKQFYRCKSKVCREGYFYGFKTQGHKLFYDINCLERSFFFTSRKTGYIN